MGIKLPDEVMMRSVMFGDGAKGMAIQQHRNEEYGVNLSAARESRDHPFIQAWTQDDCEESFETYAELRDHINGS